ncbi:MAG: hypothetical protein QOK69_05640, partial [Nitrososphaeraceae archaeon]|nr:hypothetical protein [Nitrososphaeraceae archaeon]
MLRQFEDEFNLGLTAGYCQRLKLTQDNAPVIGNYLNALKNEIHLSDSYKKINLMTLTYLSRFHSNTKFKEMEKEDILSFLNSFRKNEAIDPLHSSLATYN